MPWLQKTKKLKLERKCSHCGRTFYCSGKCGNTTKIEHKDFCYCKECAIKTGVIEDRNREPNYIGYTVEEIIKACYGED